MRRFSPLPGMLAGLFVLVALITLAAPASAQDVVNPGREGGVEFGFIGGEYINAENSSASSEPWVAGTIAVIIRDRQLSFLPTLEIGKFTDQAIDTTIFGVLPVSFSFEFPLIVQDSTSGLAFYAQLRGGLEMWIFKNPLPLNNDTEIHFWVPIDGAIGLRYYIDLLYIFVAFTGGMHIGATSTIDSANLENQWRIGGTIGIAILL